MANTSVFQALAHVTGKVPRATEHGLPSQDTCRNCDGDECGTIVARVQVVEIDHVLQPTRTYRLAHETCALDLQTDGVPDIGGRCRELTKQCAHDWRPSIK